MNSSIKSNVSSNFLLISLGQEKIAEFLIANGACPNLADNYGENALHSAAAGNGK